MLLLLLMIFVMPFEANPYLLISESFLGIVPDFTVIKLLGLLGFVWAAAQIVTGDREARILASPQSRLFVVFFVGSIVAAFLSGSPGIVNPRYLAFLLFLPFILVAVRTHDDLRRVIYALALSLLVVFPYALRQMFRFDSRFGTGLYESNYLGANLILVIPLAFVIASQQTNQLKRWFWIAGASLLVLGLVLTSSRGALLGLLVGGVIFAYRRRGVLGVLGLLGAVVLLALPTEIGERALATLRDNPDDLPPGLEASNRAHVALFWAGLRMIADHPWTGVGPFNFKAYSTDYSGLGRGYIGHNSYLELGAEHGLPLLIVFLALLVLTFGVLRRATALGGSREAIELAGWSEAMITGLIGFLIAGFFISAQYEKLFWVVVFLSIVLDRLARRHWREQAADPASDELVMAEPTSSPRPLNRAW